MSDQPASRRATPGFAFGTPMPPRHRPRHRPRRRLYGALGTFCRRKPLGAFGAAVLAVMIVVAVFAPWIARDPANVSHLGDQFAAPGNRYWFGTDQNGRDIFSRVVYGCEVAVMVGLGACLIASVVALVTGAVSGYLGGRADFAIQRFVDTWQSFPAIFLILTMVAVLNVSDGRGFLGLGRGPAFGPNPAGGDWLWQTFPRVTIVTLTLGLVLAGGASRVVRAAVLAIRSESYVEAARALGASDRQVLLAHVLPNILPVLLVLATVQFGTAILAEATISFLGLGVTNFPTWGQMLTGQARLAIGPHPHVVFFPGAAIFLAVFGGNMLGDALRDVLDPRQQGSRG